jgi:hypothetical protein
MKSFQSSDGRGISHRETSDNVYKTGFDDFTENHENQKQLANF